MSDLTIGDIIEVVPLRQTNRGWYLCPLPLIISRNDIRIGGNELKKSNYEIGDRVVVKIRGFGGSHIVASLVDDEIHDIDHSAAKFGKRVYEMKYDEEEIKQDCSNETNKNNQIFPDEQNMAATETGPYQDITEHKSEMATNIIENKPDNSSVNKINSSESDDDLKILRRQAEEAAIEEVPEVMTSTSRSSPQYNRSQKVKTYAKARADGICEGCGEPAPFISTTGEPYLHVHHIHELSDGGSDTPDTVAALCPNCHYRIHHGKNGEKYNQEILNNITDLEN